MTSKNVEKFLEKILLFICKRPGHALVSIEPFGERFTHDQSGLVLHFKNGYDFAIRITNLKTGV